MRCAMSRGFALSFLFASCCCMLLSWRLLWRTWIASTPPSPSPVIPYFEVRVAGSEALLKADVPSLGDLKAFGLCLFGTINGAKKELVEYYSHELKGLADFWVLYDSTCDWMQEQRMKGFATTPCGRGDDFAALDTMVASGMVKVFVYNDSSLMEAYPGYNPDTVTGRVPEEGPPPVAVEDPDAEATGEGREEEQQRQGQWRRRQLLLSSASRESLPPPLLLPFEEEPQQWHRRLRSHSYVVRGTFLGLWVEAIRDEVLLQGQSLGYLWVVESDSLFAGHVSSFLREVDAMPELAGIDYLTPYLRPLASLPHWPHGDKGTWPLPPQGFYLASDMLQRFTPALVDAMADALRLNLVLHGDAFAASLCAGLGWCRAAEFGVSAASLRGPPLAGLLAGEEADVLACEFGRGCEVSQQEFDAHLANASYSEAKWYHRCPFSEHWQGKNIYAQLPP